MGDQPARGKRIDASPGDGPQPPSGRRSGWLMAATLAIGLALLVVGLVTVEVGLRLFRRHTLTLSAPKFVPDPVLGYRLNPDLFSTSFLGEGVPSERHGRAVIVCLGASTTFGHVVGAAQVWPGVMRDTLRALNVAAVVVNAGVPGYGSRQLLLRYRSQIAALRPDIIVVYEGWNRTGILRDSSAWEPFGIGAAGPMDRALLALAEHSQLAREVLGTLYRRRQLALAGWRPDPFAAAWEADMDSLVREIAAHGQRPMVVLYPALYHDGMSSADLSLYAPKGWKGRRFDRGMLVEIRAKHAALRRIAATEGTVLLDVDSAFAGLHAQQRTDLFLDEMHPSAAGHARIGGLAARAVAGMQAVGGRSAPSGVP